MDCVTTRLQMEIGMFFLSLTLKNARKLRKLAKFSLGVREPRKNLGKMTKKGRQKFINFPKKMYTFFGGPRTEKKFVKWSASRKRLRTAVLTISIYNVGYAYYVLYQLLPPLRPQSIHQLRPRIDKCILPSKDNSQFIPRSL